MESLANGAEKICYKLQTEENEKMDGFIKELSSIRFYDKERLDIIIEAVTELIEKGGLKML